MKKKRRRSSKNRHEKSQGTTSLLMKLVCIELRCALNRYGCYCSVIFSLEEDDEEEDEGDAEEGFVPHIDKGIKNIDYYLEGITKLNALFVRSL